MVSIGRVGGGIIEGDYTSWKKKWINEPDNGLYSADEMGLLIDEKNETLNIFYDDNVADNRFGIYNLSDFSPVFESPRGSDYPKDEPYQIYNSCVNQGIVSFYYGGVSHSLQTYLLFLRADKDTIEVWRSGATALWSANTEIDFGRVSTCQAAGISQTGKYVLAVVHTYVAPSGYYLIFYEGE